MMARNDGYPSSCRVSRWCPTLDLSRSVAFTTAPEREQAACSISSLGKARKTRIQCPRQPAAEAGISLRYLQKLFTQRGSTCGEFIYSLRLDHAARLLHRRKFLGTGQPVSEIAYACGFRDYTHFARKFRCQFGYAPRAHSGAHHRASGITCVNTGESASSAHD